MRWAHSAVDYLAAAVGGAVVWEREMFEVGVVGQSLEREWEEMDSVPFQALLFHKCVVQLLLDVRGRTGTNSKMWLQIYSFQI